MVDWRDELGSGAGDSCGAPERRGAPNRATGAAPAAVPDEVFEREAVMQRIVQRLRQCSLETLEAVAGILEQGRTRPGV